MLIPCTMAVTGRIMAAHPPGKPNQFLGYRTRRSTMSSESWKFAQVYSGKKMEWFGLIMLLPAAVSMLPAMDFDDDAIGLFMVAVLAAEMIIMMVPIVLTEKALKEKFGDPPKRKRDRRGPRSRHPKTGCPAEGRDPPADHSLSDRRSALRSGRGSSRGPPSYGFLPRDASLPTTRSFPVSVTA